MWTTERPTDEGLYPIREIGETEYKFVELRADCFAIEMMVQHIGTDYVCPLNNYHAVEWGPRIPSPDRLAALERLAALCLRQQEIARRLFHNGERMTHGWAKELQEIGRNYQAALDAVREAK